MEENKDNQVRAGLLFLGCNMAGLGLGFIAMALAWKK